MDECLCTESKIDLPLCGWRVQCTSFMGPTKVLVGRGFREAGLRMGMDLAPTPPPLSSLPASLHIHGSATQTMLAPNSQSSNFSFPSANMPYPGYHTPHSYRHLSRELTLSLNSSVAVEPARSRHCRNIPVSQQLLLLAAKLCSKGLTVLIFRWPWSGV